MRIKKIILVFVFLGLFGWLLQAQNFKPDRSALVARILSDHDNLRTGACERGLEILEVYYLLSEHHLLGYFPLAGIYYDEEFDLYKIWSPNIDYQHYYRCDSITIHGLRTDGKGIIVNLELYEGRLDAPTTDETAWQPGCKSLKVYVPNTDMHDGLQKLKRAKIFINDCMSKMKGEVSDFAAPEFRSWVSAEDGLKILHDSFPTELRPLEMTNFNLTYHERFSSPVTKSAYMLEVLYCAKSSMLHHLYVDASGHDGYILRYFFGAKRWTVTYVKDTITGWRTSEGYIDPNTGKITGLPR